MGTKIKRIFKKFQLKRTSVLLLLFIMLSFVLIRQLYQLQIIQGEDYIDEFQTRTTKTRVLKSTRGNIYDRNNKLIASNILSYSLTFEDNGSYDTTREKNLTLNGVAYKVLRILADNGDSLSNTFHIKLDNDGNYVFDIEPGFTLNRFKADIYGHALIDDLTEDEAAASAEDIMSYLSGSKGFSIVLYGDNAYTTEELKKYGLPEELTRQEVLDIAIMRYELSTNSFQKYMAVTIATNVSESTVAAVKENQNELQGIDVLEDSSRQYVDDESMGPLLGYTGKASSEELAALKKQNSKYKSSAVIGKAGIEQYMELELQGTDGQETVTVDNLGKVLKIDSDTTVEPQAGNDVYLSVDADWQAAIYQILKQRVAGILLNKIEAVKEFNYEADQDASRIVIPIYDVYNALISNSVIDIDKFSDENASDTEKNLYAKFQQKQQEVFDTITNRLTMDNPPAYKDESDELKEYLSYICDTILRDTLGVIKKDEVDTSDATYQAWATDHSISLKDYLNYAASQNWIDISVISPKEEYLDSNEVDTALAPCSASAVITDVKTGKVLACVSYPGYDNNKLSNNMDTSYYTKLALDQSSPFFNKATQQTTAPGSTLKLLSAVTGMMEGVIDDGTYYECTGKFDLVSPAIYCWNRQGHGSLEIRGAIEQSCNYFFNMVGFLAGKNADGDFSETLSLSKLQKYASEFALDEKTGIEISEATPHVSDSKAVPSYIGQGNHLFTTSQLARYATTLATSGTVYDLSLLNKVTDSQGKILNEYAPSVKNELSDVPNSVWEDIHDGMRRVVQTHEQFNGLGVTLSGKTGTAELDIYHPNHGLFIGYTNSPSTGDAEYAIAVRIANGYTSGNACLTANDILQYIYDLADEDTILTGYASSDTSNTSND